MRAKALLVLLGTTALGAYAVGRYSSPVSSAPVAAVTLPQPPMAKPVAFAAPVSPPIAVTANAPNNPAHTIKTASEKATPPKGVHRPRSSAKLTSH